MAGFGPMSQDWEPVVMRKKAPTAAARKDEKAVNAAPNAGVNKAASSGTSLNTRKLDDENENLSRVGVLFKLGIVLKIINEKPQIIQEYESGKAIPNQQIISKLERALGAKLRGKK
ncbi:hypothetical protein RJ640_013141 [Escallonia rubra]|uniref:HTH cro/C1-type domain-containing protein n=1 Tax=Escallonia rubra TaxID=112253 RepID=A0AA88RFQ3_9ASTE|nr:hypothetical protein RJ640_013141 [Escallonia rubra]